jgi:hypothetical protein
MNKKVKKPKKSDSLTSVKQVEPEYNNVCVIDSINELTAKQKTALPIIATTSGVLEACRLCEIGRDSYYQWMAIPAFKNAVDKLRNEVVSASFFELKKQSIRAVMTLVELLDLQDEPNIRRQAANDVLNHLAKFTELADIESRIEALEQISKERKQ